MIPHEWTIEYLHKDNVKGKNDVVNTINWRVFSLDQSAPVNIYGQTTVNYNESNAFTQYLNLTKDQVIEWIKSEMGEEEFNAVLSDLEKKAQWYKNELAKSHSLPW